MRNVCTSVYSKGMDAQSKPNATLRAFCARDARQLVDYLDLCRDDDAQARLLAEASQVFEGLDEARLRDLSVVAEALGFFDPPGGPSPSAPRLVADYLGALVGLPSGRR